MLTTLINDNDKVNTQQAIRADSFFSIFLERLEPTDCTVSELCTVSSRYVIYVNKYLQKVTCTNCEEACLFF